MKNLPGTLSNYFSTGIIFIFFLTLSFHLQAQEGKIQSLVQSKRFIFKAQMAAPLTGRPKQLTGDDYDLRIVNDTLISHLPFYGRAYSAPMNSDAGFDFTSTKFEYVAKQKKKGWEIEINLKDQQEASQFTFSISENGRATLHVTGNNRQPISFDGYITEIKN